eukprot:Opistho-1_new@22454
MGSWGQQYSCGDQSEGGRRRFWESGYRTCSGCGVAGNIEEHEDRAGCRMNGDGYGTAVFTCRSCGWKTSFQFDEAADTYYYETRSWSRGIKGMAVTQLMSWLRTNGYSDKLVRSIERDAIDGKTFAGLTVAQMTNLGATAEEAKVLREKCN